MIDLVFYSLVEVLTGFAHSFVAFLVLRALFGIGMGGEWGVGASLADVVKVGVFLADGAEFAQMNEVYAEFFGESKPARTTIVCKFMADIRVEIDCVAYSPKKP